MRFPHEAYAKMVTQEKTSEARHVAKKVADEKRIVEESAIDDVDNDENQNNEDESSEDENLAD